MGDERGMGCLGGDDGGIEVCRGDGIKEESVQEGKNAVIVVGAIIVVQVAGKGVSAVGHPRLVKKVDIIVAEGEDIVGKMTVNFLGATIVLEVLVVGEYVDDKLSSQQEVAPVFKCTNDGEEFVIPD